MQRSIRNLTLLCAVVGLCWLGAAAQTGGYGSQTGTASNKSATSESSAKLTPSEQQFLKKAAEGGLAEVEFGKLAAERGSTPEVKQFGQRMVDDHSKANDQLKQVAAEKGVTLPDKLDAKDAATKARLEKLSGKQFDQAYMQTMVTDHTKDVAEFRTEARRAKDPDLKNFASQTEPTLEDHLKQAKSIAPQTHASHKTSSASGSH
jgi:putative membrane protein